jgi:asparagine synthase (glutamine-hydrolysing)
VSAIAAYVNWGSGSSPDLAVGDMLAGQKVYGPDGLAKIRFGDVALGRVLYKLLPEDEYDRQPLTSADGRFSLVADVRLDNREELLERLRGKAGPQPLSDAALLLACLEAWGIEALERILGDYAFACWDRRSASLLLARDPLGQRPLYYHAASGFFAAATSPKGLHALTGVERAADSEWLIDFLGYVPHRGARSQYRSISRVEAGELLEVKAGRVSGRRFWKPLLRSSAAAKPEALRDAFRAELDRAVAARLRRGDGQVGSHLSGGWDSSAVTGTAARLLGPDSRLFAFTSVPRAGAAAPPLGSTFADEGPLAAQAAALHPNIAHVLVPGSGESPIAKLDALLALHDRPLATLCNNLWLSGIRRAARERGVRVLLTGEVGNWTISAAPYTLLGEFLRQGRWAAWLHEAAAVGRRGDARYRGILAASIGPFLPRRAMELAASLGSGVNTAAYHSAHPRWAETIARRRSEFFRRQPRSHYGRLADALGHRDYGDYRKGALAGWGIDERDPTADRRLAEFCLSLPLDMLLKDGERRPLARAALEDRVPAAILAQRGKGYQAADWHEGMTANRQPILDLIEEIASDSMAASLLDLEAMRAWVLDWPSGGWEDGRVMARYRTALLVGLSAGHFALRANR